MEVVTASPSGGGMSPFHNHDVREWSRLNSLTGVLERARLETDHWTMSTSTSSHNYGKVVDSRARSDAHGAVQQQAKRQLEVFQSKVPGGHLQVIKTHTVSNSRWTSSSTTGHSTSATSTTDDSRTSYASTPTPLTKFQEKSSDFEDLKLPLNPLDVTSQKSKASISRSVGRRPPSRPKVREEAFSSFNSQNQRKTSLNTNPHATASINLHRVSRICHQVHDHAVKHAFGGPRSSRPNTKTIENKIETPEKPPIHERESGDGVEIIEIESSNASDIETNHSKLTRTKSSSSEDIHLIALNNDRSKKSVEDLEDLEQLQSWRRSSKLRRSLQFLKQNKQVSSKPTDLPETTGSVRRIREDLETGRRLNTALRGNNINLEALDQILQSISSSGSIHSDKESIETDSLNDFKKEKRNSFVTVESLNEVKGRLRRTSCQSDESSKESEYSNYIMRTQKEEDSDDGIGTDDISNHTVLKTKNLNETKNVRVRSYVFGLETMLNKKPIIGTGSLESRTSKQVNANSINRNDDWYNRRKSYGFEKVHSENDENKVISFNDKYVFQSSTDSGICKSNDTMNLPSKLNGFKPNDSFINSNSDISDMSKNNKSESYADYRPPTTGNVKRFSSMFEQNRGSFSNSKNDDLGTSWNKISSQKYKNDIEGNSVTVPIKVEHYKRHLSVEDGSVANRINSSGDVKRHSIAVDEIKYVNNPLRVNEISDEVTDDDNLNPHRKQKKVEFCKTEVHFAPDSGKINIIETDEKPPPTNNFRRRRRNSGSSYVEMIAECNKKGVPTLHFGDNYVNDSVQDQLISPNPIENTVTVTTNGNIEEYFENNTEDKENSEGDVPKGILKNKPIKPKPYILGDINNSLQNTNFVNNEIWGVKLKPVKIEDSPMWKSTVTLKTKTFDSSSNNVNNLERTHNMVIDKVLETKDTSDKIRIISSKSDDKNSDNKVKHFSPNHKTGTGGFSTKVNIGGNDLPFAQNSVVYNGLNSDTHISKWIKNDEVGDDFKSCNRSLVVRIGRNDQLTKQNNDCDILNNKMTTKITIDLTPSSKTEITNNSFKKLPPTTTQEFKSTSLILNTLKSEIHNKSNLQNLTDVKASIPKQLEELKKLYEDALSDSEADKEVQKLMNRNGFESGKETDDECNSIVSGSWSKIKAFKIMAQGKNKSQHELKLQSTFTEKGSRCHNLTGRTENIENLNTDVIKKNEEWKSPSSNIHNIPIQVSQSVFNERKISLDNSHSQNNNLSTNYPKITPIDRDNNEHYYETLSRFKKNTSSSRERIYENAVQKKNTHSQNIKHSTEKIVKDKTNRSPSPRTVKSSRTPPPLAVVVRNLRKSDTKYFGLKEAATPPIPPEKYHKKTPSNDIPSYNANKHVLTSENLPKDYFQKKNKPTQKEISKRSTQKTNIEERKYSSNNKVSSPQRPKNSRANSPKHKLESKIICCSSPFQKNCRPESPIYENIDEVLDKPRKSSEDFDSSILDELTKAADQILQAVSNYADEESISNLVSDEEDKNKRNLEKLETISETKSWHQKKVKNQANRQKQVKPTVKRTSSTSSVESTPEKGIYVNQNRRSLDSDKHRRRSIDSSSVKAATKARRLQRANSREALLVSHSSSSEDLPVKDEVMYRKPRILRKTKFTQLKITNGHEIQKKSVASVKNYGNSRSNSEEKTPLAALPEIRHKTAVSTIRSTAEKMASKEKANRIKTDERKKYLLAPSRRDNIQETSKNAQEVTKHRNFKQKNKKR